MSASNIPPRLQYAAAAADPITRAHRYAMAAKECTFTAQDEVSRAWLSRSPNRRRAATLRKLERRLARVRAELEQLDNDYKAAAAAGIGIAVDGV